MSNKFLDHFTDDKYDKLLNKKEDTKEVVLEEKEIVKEERERQVTGVKEEPKQKRRRSDSVEVINRDPNYQNKKIIQHALLVVAVLVIVVGGFLFFRITGERTLPQFVNKPVSELQNWAKNNEIELDISKEYSMKIDKDFVISVNEKSGKKISRGDLLRVRVSEGANPEENIILPDFSKYDEQKINEWVKENRAYNLKVVKEYHDTFEKTKFIKLEFADKGIKPEEYKRKDYVTVYVSKGKETHEKNIEVPQFVKEDASKVSEWAAKNEVKLKQSESYSASIEAGKVISQSVPAKEKVAKKDEFSIEVSKGKATVIPNFSKYNLHTINETGGSEGIPYLVVERYHAGVPYGQFISQDVTPGTIIEEGNIDNVVVVYSIGLPYINREDVVNKSEKEIRDYFYIENEKGANITYTIQRIAPISCTFKPGVKGITCGANFDNQFVQIGSHILIQMANADSPQEE